MPDFVSFQVGLSLVQITCSHWMCGKVEKQKEEGKFSSVCMLLLFVTLSSNVNGQMMLPMSIHLFMKLSLHACIHQFIFVMYIFHSFTISPCTFIARDTCPKHRYIVYYCMIVLSLQFRCDNCLTPQQYKCLMQFHQYQHFQLYSSNPHASMIQQLVI